MGDADWDQESAYARYVLRGPSLEDLYEREDLERKRRKEEQFEVEYLLREDD